jgi:hypothetical protein
MSVCPTCSLRGPHEKTEECISALARELASVKSQAELHLNSLAGFVQQAKIDAMEAKQIAEKLRGEFAKHTAHGKGTDHPALT